VVSADSQYNTGPELAELEEQGIVGYLRIRGRTALRAGEPGEGGGLGAVRAEASLSEETMVGVAAEFGEEAGQVGL